MKSKNPSHGFTLIELLVVISIIALLVGLLLPALGRARNAAREAGCLSNQKQLAAAFFLYANDFDVIPGGADHGPDKLDWCGKSNPRPQNEHPFKYGRIFPYVSNAYTAVECPTGKRFANNFFDYCLVAGLAGARTDLQWRCRYPVDPSVFRGEMAWFQGVPLLVEEDEIWYNTPVNDGTWAWSDQFSDRHDGKCSVSYLDGSAGMFKTPKGRDPNIEETADLKALNIRLWVNNQKEYQMLHKSARNRFGWINAPIIW
jgi:prepilin-type N-terminal cleavage/methylation domain-containing protein/prepilin-type processing-associated H-X9-DG protein